MELQVKAEVQGHCIKFSVINPPKDFLVDGFTVRTYDFAFHFIQEGKTICANTFTKLKMEGYTQLECETIERAIVDSIGFISYVSRWVKYVPYQLLPGDIYEITVPNGVSIEDVLKTIADSMNDREIIIDIDD